jgi:hypothetical protein
MFRVLSGLVFALVLSAPAIAAPQTLSLSVDADGGLAGPGATVLKGELTHAQFILYGEDHGFADSPIVLRAIAHDARPLGFKYHVVEVGPLSVRLIRETLSREGMAGLHRLVHAVPLGIPFLSLKDDVALASDFQGEDARGTPYLWGVDQEFIGSPVFHLKRLVALAPSADARATVSKLLAEEQDAAAKATINTVDLGTLASKIAQVNGKTALRIAFLPIGGRNIAFAPKPGNPTTVEAYDSPDVKEFFAAIGLDASSLPKVGWTLILLEPIRQALDTKGIVALKPFSRFTLLGYDYVITTPDAKPGVSLY